MWQCRWWQWLPAILSAGGLLLAGQTVLANESKRPQQREQFRQAWSALARADWDQARAIATKLEEYPLLPYLRAEQMRQRPSAFSYAQIVAYLQRHENWAFHDNLRRNWLRTLGRDGHLQRLLAHATSSDTDTEVRCYLARALIDHQQRSGEQEQQLQILLQDLWLIGKSLHKACDAAFDWWRRQAGISSALAWQRAGLAMAAGNSGLVRYLQRFMSPVDRHWLQR